MGLNLTVGFWIIAGIFGVSLQLNWLAGFEHVSQMSAPAFWGRIFGGLIIGPGVFATGQWITRKALQSTALSDSQQQKFMTMDRWTYLPFLMYAAGAFGVVFTTSLKTIVILLFFAAKFICFANVLDAGVRRKFFRSTEWLATLFFLSGFAALIYQIAWQRVLFASYGVNIESVTMIVSIFMFGLGIGSICGGVVSKHFKEKIPQLFFICEIAIASFGFISIPLIKTVSTATLGGSLFQVSLAVFGLLLVPTIFMGATLPILVTYLHEKYKHVGMSVGLLYFINTLGSAFACFITANLLFVFGGLQTAVAVAATFNLITGILVFQFIRNESTADDPLRVLQTETKA